MRCKQTKCSVKTQSGCTSGSHCGTANTRYWTTPRHILSLIAALSFIVTFFGMAHEQVKAQNNKFWIAGNFSFSDELGGFRITGVAGDGTRENPAIVYQVFDTAYSGTMVIRRLGPIERQKKDAGLGSTHGTVYMKIVTANNSNLSWVGFGFELQEILNVVSTYGDGLSFDQISRQRSDVYSDRFSDFEDQFEPGDRLVYTNGFVNNQTNVTTAFVITDFTPTREFYLLQDPQIPAS